MSLEFSSGPVSKRRGFFKMQRHRSKKSKKHAPAAGTVPVAIPVVETYKIFSIIAPPAKEENELVSHETREISQRYDKGIIELRNLLAEKGRKCMTIPVLCNDKKYLDLRLRDRHSQTIMVRLRFNDVYLIGVKKKIEKINETTGQLAEEEIWYEFKDKNKDQEIPGSTVLKYTGSYRHIDPKHVVKEISYMMYDDAIGYIYKTTDTDKWKRSLSVIIKAICEAIRFTRVQKNMRMDYGYVACGLSVNRLDWTDLLTIWGKMGDAAWALSKDMNLVVDVSGGMFHFTTADDLVPELGIIKAEKEPV